MSFSFFTKAVGTTFEGRQEVIAQLKTNNKLALRREPENEYDANAVAIDALVDGRWVPVGYIAKASNSDVCKEMDDGNTVNVELKEVTGGGDKNYGINVAISYKSAGEIKLTKLIPDIGNGFVMFDEVNHIYYDENGNRMISGSVFESEHEPVTDFSYAAKAMAKSTGVKPAHILALWDDNKNLSATYGTLIHKGLETYFKDHHLMKQLDASKERDHTATTYMPQAVGEIVDSYLALHDAGFADRVSPELFVRYEGYCGFIDLLEEDGELVNLHDYKFIKKLRNINYKKYGKHTKYSLQQNFYRHVIESNGMKVGSMNLDIYKDGKWESVMLEKIDLGL